MKIYQFYSCLLFLVCSTSSLFAQNESKQVDWAIQINAQQQDLAATIDFGQLGVVHDVSIRPRFSVEAQRLTQKKRNRKRLYSFQLGYYNNLYHDRWWSAQFGMGSEWQLPKGLFLNARSELGMALVQNTDLQYEYDGEQWVKAKNSTGAGISVLLGTGLDFGYRISEGEHPIDVVLNGRLQLVASDFGLLPYYAYGVGMRYGF